MSHKFFDIIPPGEFPSEEIEVSKKTPERKAVTKLSPTKTEIERLTFSIWKKQKKIFSIILIGAFVLIFGICLGAFVEPQAKIEISPKAEKRIFETELTVSLAIKEIDTSKKIIPGEIITTESSISQEFPSTGTIQKKEKAKGTIRVYNNYSFYQILVATTRFLSSDGKLFRSLERVYIPSGQYKDIAVAAAEPGKEYNIGPTTFSIPGLAGSSRYTVVYGKSFSVMEGGEIAERKIVLQDDLDNAQDSLKEKVLQKSKNALEEKLTKEMIVLPGAIEQEMIEVSPLAKEGQELDSFVFQTKAGSRAFIFYKSDIVNFVEKYIASQIQPSEKFRREIINYDYSVEGLNLKQGSAKLNIIMRTDVYSEIDKNKLKEAVKGKSKKEIEKLLKEYLEIDGFKISFSPFWIRECPDNIGIVDKFE